LCFLAIGRRWKRHQPESARAYPLGHRSDGATLAGGVATFKHDDDALALLLDPVL
jgi:hypothetical protein